MYESLLVPQSTGKMTLESHQEKEFTLKCNISACDLEIADKSFAWITACDHIFCSSCGLTQLGETLPVKCPICAYELHNPLEIMRAEINPPRHFIKVFFVASFEFNNMYHQVLECQQTFDVSTASSYIILLSLAVKRRITLFYY